MNGPWAMLHGSSPAQLFKNNNKKSAVGSERRHYALQTEMQRLTETQRWRKRKRHGALQIEATEKRRAERKRQRKKSEREKERGLNVRMHCK